MWDGPIQRRQLEAALLLVTNNPHCPPFDSGRRRSSRCRPDCHYCAAGDSKCRVLAPSDGLTWVVLKGVERWLQRSSQQEARLLRLHAMRCAKR